MIGWLEEQTCLWAGDIVPLSGGIEQANGFDLGPGPELIIENLPRSIAIKLAEHWVLQCGRTAWLLLPERSIFNCNWSRLARHTARIVTAGRTEWFPNGGHRAKDDAAWIQLEPNGSHDVLKPRPSILGSRS